MVLMLQDLWNFQLALPYKHKRSTVVYVSGYLVQVEREGSANVLRTFFVFRRSIN